MSDIVDMEFTEATDKIARLYPPALSRFRKNLEANNFSPEESFDLVKIYLKLLVSLVFDAENNVEEEEDNGEEYPL